MVGQLENALTPVDEDRTGVRVQSKLQPNHDSCLSMTLNWVHACLKPLEIDAAWLDPLVTVILMLETEETGSDTDTKTSADDPEKPHNSWNSVSEFLQ